MTWDIVDVNRRVCDGEKNQWTPSSFYFFPPFSQKTVTSFIPPKWRLDEAQQEGGLGLGEQWEIFQSNEITLGKKTKEPYRREENALLRFLLLPFSLSCLFHFLVKTVSWPWSKVGEQTWQSQGPCLAKRSLPVPFPSLVISLAHLFFFFFLAHL